MGSHLQTAKKPVARTTLVMVAGIILLQLLRTTPNLPTTATFASFDGGLSVSESALPDAIDTFQKTKFSAPSSDQATLSERGYTSHSWTYLTDTMGCIVSLDQSHWTSWHELTRCYRNQGWQLTSRKIHDDDWRYVTAEFKRHDGHFAYLAFSMAYLDGRPVPPNQEGPLTLTDRLNANTDQLDQYHTPSNRSSRAVQFQVFMVSGAILPPEQTDLALNLHLTTRQILLEEVQRQAGQIK